MGQSVQPPQRPRTIRVLEPPPHDDPSPHRRPLEAFLAENEYGSLSHVVHFLSVEFQLQLRLVSHFFQQVVQVSLSLRPLTLSELYLLTIRWNRYIRRYKAPDKYYALHRIRDGREPRKGVAIELWFLRPHASVRVVDVIFAKKDYEMVCHGSQKIENCAVVILSREIPCDRVPLLVWMWKAGEELEKTCSMWEKWRVSDQASCRPWFGVIQETRFLRDDKSRLLLRIGFAAGPNQLPIKLTRKEVVDFYNECDGLIPFFPAEVWKVWMMRFSEGSRELMNRCELFGSLLQYTSIMNAFVPSEPAMQYLLQRGLDPDPLLQNISKMTPSIVLSLVSLCLRWKPSAIKNGVLLRVCKFWAPKYGPILRDMTQTCELDVNAAPRDFAGRSPLWFLVASRWSTLADCRVLVENGADVNHVDHSGRSVLRISFEKRQFDKAEWLLRNGAILSGAWDDVESCLNAIQVLDYLAKRSHDVCEELGPSLPGCIYACHLGNIETLKKFVAANPECFPKETRLVLFEKMVSRGSVNCIRSLLRGGFVSLSDRPLHGVVSCGLSLPNYDTLLSYVVCQCAQRVIDIGFLRKALSWSEERVSFHPDSAYLLRLTRDILGGPSWSEPRFKILTCLLERVSFPQPSLADDENQILQEAKSFGLVYFAFLFGRENVVLNSDQFGDSADRLLFQRRFGSQRGHMERYSLLHLICCEGDIHLAEVSLHRGASVDVQARNRRTPIDLAAERKHWELVAILIARWNASVGQSFQKKYKRYYLKFLMGQE